MTQPLNTAQAADADVLLGEQAEPRARSQWGLFWRRFVRHRVALISVIVLLVIAGACFGARWIAFYPRDDQDLARDDLPPSVDHWFGTDGLGRDYLTETLYAGRVSLSIGIGVAIASAVIGSLLGAAAGYFRGRLDQVLSRITDLFLIVPALLVAVIGMRYVRTQDQFLWWDLGDRFLFFEVSKPFALVVILSFVSWTYTARLVRGQVLGLREKEYVEAARAAGAGGWRIIFRHILPNSVGVIMVNATLTIGIAIVFEATLAYLGFGLQYPDYSWGRLIYDNRSAGGRDDAYLLYFPGLMLFLTILAVNFIGDGLRDAFDPRGKQERI